MASVLEGIRVLDLSSGIAGPVAGMQLADHGANVIKIEPPGGDPFRGIAGYDAWLRGRRSVELDLRDTGDKSVFDALVGTADVVIQSYEPGVAERLGVDGATLLAANPRLVVCSISAYGRHRSHRDRPGYDALVAARLGLLHEQRGHMGGPIGHMNGEGDFLPEIEIPEGMAPGSPRTGPILTYTPWTSFCTAFLALSGISAALFARERTGRGQHVETSMLQAAMSAAASKWQRAENNTARGYRTWTYDTRATKGYFKCSDDRWIQQWVPNPRFILSSADGDTLELRGTNSVVNDPERITTEPENIVVLAHYYPLLADAVSKFPSADWVRVGAQANVPLQPVRTNEEALLDETLIAEGAVTDVPHPLYGTLRQAGILYTLSETPGRVQGPVPLVGQHNAEIRAEATAAIATEATTATSATTTATAATAASGTSGRTVGRTGELNDGPLTGITVLDLGFAVAGPFGAQVLADLGANVIKVNAYRDPFWHATHIAYGSNRNKRSIGLDLKAPDGNAAFRRLVERADVVHSNMRRGALRRLGCDEESLRKINPRLIYCHTRGFDKGPRSDSPGNDQTGNSLAGVTYEDGGMHDGGTPFWSLTSLGDTGNGFFSAIAVMQALLHRERFGVGQSVDTSILNSGLLVSTMASIKPDGTSLPRPRLDRMQYGLGAGYRLYNTSDDEWVCIALITPEHWATFAGVLGLSADQLRADLPRRDMEALIEPWFATRTAEESWKVLDAAGVPSEICNGHFGYGVHGKGGVHDDPEMLELGLVTKKQHPKLGLYEYWGNTIDFSDTPTGQRFPPPICGQHTREILAENGFDDVEVDALFASKAIYENRWVD